MFQQGVLIIKGGCMLPVVRLCKKYLRNFPGQKNRRQCIFPPTGNGVQKKVAGARARRARRASAKFEEVSEAGGIVAQERKLRVSGNNE